MKQHSQRAGDIYLVRFHPGFGSELKMYRPAVVVSSKVSHIDERFTVIAPFTTSTKSGNTQFELLIDNPALEKPSLLLAWYLKTIDVQRLSAHVGRLSKQDITRLQQAIVELF